MAKKIKSFTVDEDVYNRLVSIFKVNRAETSISLYLNNNLKSLLELLEDLEKGIKEMNYSIPMSYIIDEIVKNSEYSGRLSSEPYEEELLVSDLEMALNDWQKSYDADQKGIPYEYYDMIQTGKYVLSKDKKFIIEKETGKKYISQDNNRFMEVRGVDSEDKS
jgi:hypothetical protein